MQNDEDDENINFERYNFLVYVSQTVPQLCGKSRE